MDPSQPRDRKRKRQRALSDAVINPLSHPPDTLRQFTLAGYPADQPLPHKVHPGFPHRPARSPGGRRRGSAAHSRAAGGGDDDDDGDLYGSKSGAGASDADIDTNFEDGSGGAGEFFDDDDDDDGDDDRDTNTIPPDADSGWHHHPTTPGGMTTDGETTDAETRGRTGRTPRRSGSSGTQRGGDGSSATDRRAHAYQARVGCLVAVVRRCLAEGDVGTARRAFGLLARARVYGRAVDLRWGRYWEMGAEVLMREGEEKMKKSQNGGTGVEGEEDDEGEGVDGMEVAPGLGFEHDDDDDEEEAAAARLARLKAYYEFLIHQYPYSKQHAAISANSVIDFHVALFSAEMEAAHAAQTRGLQRLQRGDDTLEEEEDDDVMDVDDGPVDYGLRLGSSSDEDAGDGGLPSGHLAGLSRRERRLRGKEDKLRRAALRRMVDVAERMDTVMETLPFSRDRELLRLRAMVALYIGDLQMPPPPRSGLEDRDGRRAQARERRRAKDLLRRIKQGGGKLGDHDEALLESLETDDDEEDEEDEGGSVLPMFSSMQT